MQGGGGSRCSREKVVDKSCRCSCMCSTLPYLDFMVDLHQACPGRSPSYQMPFPIRPPPAHPLPVPMRESSLSGCLMSSRQA